MNPGKLLKKRFLGQIQEILTYCVAIGCRDDGKKNNLGMKNRNRQDGWFVRGKPREERRLEETLKK